MGKDEILSSGLADQSRIGAVALDVLANQCPHAAEHLGGSGEMETCHSRIGQYIAAYIGSPAGNEVDNAGRKSCLLKKSHEVVVGERRGLGRFPNDGVAHDGRSRRQVAADGCKVKR